MPDYLSCRHAAREPLGGTRPVALTTLQYVNRCVHSDPTDRNVRERIRPITPILFVMDDRFTNDVDAGLDDGGNRTMKRGQHTTAIGAEREIDTAIGTPRI